MMAAIRETEIITVIVIMKEITMTVMIDGRGGNMAAVMGIIEGSLWCKFKIRIASISSSRKTSG
jgi:hypothetical protein